MKDPKIDIKLDNNLDATIIIECPNCRKTHKKQLGGICPNSFITCSCGQVLSFSGDDLRKLQKEFDNLNRRLENFKNL